MLLDNTTWDIIITTIGSLEENDGDNHHISSGIARIDKKKVCSRQYKQKLEFKRRRKYGQLARTKEQIYETRVDCAMNSCGAKGHKTYRAKFCRNHDKYLVSKRTKSTNLVNATGNDVNEVRIKNKKK